MASPPRLTYDGENRLKVNASLGGGRYYFSLRDRARTFLHDTLSLGLGDAVPWRLFKVLVLVGDANLPNPQDPLELADDLVEPSAHRAPTDEEAAKLSEYLQATRVTDRQLTALASELVAADIDEHVELDEIGSEAERDDEPRERTDERTGTSATESPVGEDEPAAEADGPATGADGPATGADESPAGTGESATDQPGEEFDVNPLVEAMTGLGERLAESDARTLAAMSTAELADLYSLLSAVKQESDALRTDARDVLVERLADGERIDGDAGTVACSTRRRRSLKEESEVFARLSEADVPQTEVMSVQLDREKLESVAAEHGIPESDLFEVSETRYVRRTSN